MAIKAQWFGPEMIGNDGETVHRWLLRWSDNTLDVYFIIALIAVVLLLRILELLRGLELSAINKVRVDHKP